MRNSLPPAPCDHKPLLIGYRPVALALSRRYASPWSDAEHLQRIADDALVQAIGRFQPGRGLPFAAFAVRSIVRELRREDRRDAPALRRHVDERVRRAHGAVTVAAIAAELCVHDEDVVEARLAARSPP
jgi:RNA polymerase sigma-B factor